MKKCPYCLAELHDTAVVCSYCNSDVAATVPMRVVVQQYDLEQARKRNKFVTFMIAGFSITLLVMLIVGALIFLWNF